MCRKPISAPFVMTQLFHWGTRPQAGHSFPGAPLLLGALMLTASGLLVALAMRRLRGVASPTGLT